MDKTQAEIRSEYYAAAIPEFDAACILVQLSGDSHSNATAGGGGGREEESVGDTTASGGGAAAATVAVDSDRLSASSHADRADGCGEIEVYPLRRKRKFRSVLELYAITKKSRNKSSRYVFQ